MFVDFEAKSVRELAFDQHGLPKLGDENKLLHEEEMNNVFASSEAIFRPRRRFVPIDEVPDMAELNEEDEITDEVDSDFYDDIPAIREPDYYERMALEHGIIAYEDEIVDMIDHGENSAANRYLDDDSDIESDSVFDLTDDDIEACLVSEKDIAEWDGKFEALAEEFKLRPRHIVRSSPRYLTVLVNSISRRRVPRSVTWKDATKRPRQRRSANGQYKKAHKRAYVHELIAHQRDFIVAWAHMVAGA